MVRRGQQGRRALKRARAEAAREVDRKQGEYRPPDRVDCVDKVWYEFQDDAGTIRLAVRIWRSNGRLVDFVILVELMDWGDAWAPIARIDCCWGFCHLHPPDHEEQHQPLLRLDVVDDVQNAYSLAIRAAEDIARTIRTTGRGSNDRPD